jgi:octaprenyl-diphosphate synthase
MQLANIGNCEMSESNYREVIRCKTALLFEAAAHTGALLAAGQPSDGQTVEALRRFGLHFGLAYQLIDDWLDYAGDSELMGKNVGDDLAEGKLTLPLITALKTAAEPEQQVIREAIRDRACDRIDHIHRIVRDCGALDYTRQAAVNEGNQAIAQLDALPRNAYTEAMRTLTHYSLSRLS